MCVHSNKQESSVKKNRRLTSRLKGRSMLLPALHLSFAHPTDVPWQTWSFSTENLCLDSRPRCGLVASIPPSVRELATEILPFSFVAPVFTVLHTEISSLRASIVRICWTFLRETRLKGVLNTPTHHFKLGTSPITANFLRILFEPLDCTQYHVLHSIICLYFDMIKSISHAPRFDSSGRGKRKTFSL